MKKIIWIIVLALITALIIIFWPSKVESRFSLDDFTWDDFVGGIYYYGEEEYKNGKFSIDDEFVQNELVDYIGQLKTIPSLSKNEFPPNGVDHRYQIRLTDWETDVSVMFVINGRSITVVRNGRSKKYQIIPRQLNLQELDNIIAKEVGYIEDGTFIEQIEFNDISDSASYPSPFEKGVSVEYMDGHMEDYRRIIFNGYKPYSNLELYGADETLVIIYNEGEGEPVQVVLDPESYPFYPMGATHSILFLLNGERNYSVEYFFGIE